MESWKVERSLDSKTWFREGNKGQWRAREARSAEFRWKESRMVGKSPFSSGKRDKGNKRLSRAMGRKLESYLIFLRNAFRLHED